MSRSKKAPIATQGYGGVYRKQAKRQAAKAVRNKKLDETPKNGKAYKKEYNSWNICDWKFKDSSKKGTRK